MIKFSKSVAKFAVEDDTLYCSGGVLTGFLRPPNTNRDC